MGQFPLFVPIQAQNPHSTFAFTGIRKRHFGRKQERTVVPLERNRIPRHPRAPQRPGLERAL